MQLSDDDEYVSDTDALLQAKFASGEIQPGLVVLKQVEDEDDEQDDSVVKKEGAKVFNDVKGMKVKLESMKLNPKFGWLERLDITNGLAPLAPEIALQVDGHREKRERAIKELNSKKAKKKGVVGPKLRKIEEDPIHNDFIREMNFYRQGQEAILKALPKLKEMNVPTKRPDDYFAEMAKTDEHMQKVAAVLIKKQSATERAEKVRKLRQQKKLAKQTQIEVQQEKQKAKKELLESVKKYQKGQKNALDFLDEGKGKGKKRKAEEEDEDDAGPIANDSDDDELPVKAFKGDSGESNGVSFRKKNYKREYKDEKYGYGGPKRGLKRNTRESTDDIDDSGSSRGRGRGGRGFGGRGRGISNGFRGSRGRGGFGDRGRGRGESRGGRGGFRGSRGGFGDRGGRGGRGGSGDRGGRGGFRDRESRGSFVDRGGRGGFGGRGGRGGFGDRGGRGGFGSRGGRGGSGDRGGRGGFGGRGGRGGFGGRGGRGGFGGRGGRGG